MVSVIVDQTTIRTSGLRNIVGFEVEAVWDRKTCESPMDIMNSIIETIKHDSRVWNQAAFSCGFWKLRLREKSPTLLELLELSPDGESFVAGIALTCKYMTEQRALTEAMRATFDPPNADQLVVVSKGVLDSPLPVGGVRYPSPKHMSGWWLTTELYDGNIATLETHHAYHLAKVRPDLARFLALPFGWRFETGPIEQVWFDAEASK